MTGTARSSAAGEASSPARVPRSRLLVRLALLTVGVLVVDQATKILALRELQEGRYVPLLGDVFGLTLVFNPGAAFSFATGATWMFTVIAVLVTGAIVGMSRRLGSRGWALALGALLGGNLGNLVDRLFRDPGFPQGHVVDFLNYNGWFVGNVADIAIVLAAVSIALLALLGIGVDGSRAHGARAGDDAGTDDQSTHDQSTDDQSTDDQSTDDQGPDGAPDDGGGGPRASRRA